MVVFSFIWNIYLHSCKATIVCIVCLRSSFTWLKRLIWFNMGSVISSHSHNIQVLQRCTKNYGCHCKKKESYPLDNKCLTLNVIYDAQITNNANDEHKKYLGASETSFKERYNNHTRDFKHKKYMESTELSKYIWCLKNQRIRPIDKCRIVKKVSCKVSPSNCTLCLTEKSFIIKSLDDCSLLNKRSDLLVSAGIKISCYYAT